MKIFCYPLYHPSYDQISVLSYLAVQPMFVRQSLSLTHTSPPPPPQEEHQAGDGAPGDGELHAIQFQRGYRGFGFSIRGGREFDNMALYVLRIAENGPAALDGRLRVRR